MATITRRKRANSEIFYTATVRRQAAGKSLSKSFNRRRDAESWAREQETAIQQGTLTGGSLIYTVGDAFNEYMQDEQFLRLRSRVDRERQLDWWRDRIGSKRIGQLTDVDVQQCLRELLKQGPKGKRPLSGASVNRYRGCLSAALEFARRELKWISSNPVSLTRKLRESRGRTRFLREDERERLLAACKPNADLYSMLLLAITTGARLGEILAARWSHVDLKERTWLVPHTKTDEPRMLPLAEVVVADLKHRVRRLPPHDYVFVHRSDPRKKATLPDKPWRHARAAAELEDFRFHDLRHTAASYLAMNGASTRQLADLLGHKTLAMVQRYSHLTVESRRELVDFLGSKLA